jgi:hypothetical protein
MSLLIKRLSPFSVAPHAVASVSGCVLLVLRNILMEWTTTYRLDRVYNFVGSKHLQKTKLIIREIPEVIGISRACEVKMTEEHCKRLFRISLFNIKGLWHACSQLILEGPTQNVFLRSALSGRAL